MHDLRVPTINLPVEIRCTDGQSVLGEIFLPSQSSRQHGPMRPDEWIETAHAFFPFRSNDSRAADDREPRHGGRGDGPGRGQPRSGRGSDRHAGVARGRRRRRHRLRGRHRDRHAARPPAGGRLAERRGRVLHHAMPDPCTTSSRSATSLAWPSSSGPTHDAASHSGSSCRRPGAGHPQRADGRAAARHGRHEGLGPAPVGRQRADGAPRRRDEGAPRRQCARRARHRTAAVVDCDRHGPARSSSGGTTPTSPTRSPASAASAATCSWTARVRAASSASSRARSSPPRRWGCRRRSSTCASCPRAWCWSPDRPARANRRRCARSSTTSTAPAPTTSSPSKTRSSSSTRTRSAWSTSARSATTPTRSRTRCGRRCARTPTSSWSARCAIWRRWPSPSKPPRPVTWSSARCTPPRRTAPSTASSTSSRPSGSSRSA